MFHLIVNPDAGKHNTLRAARTVADYFNEKEQEYVIHEMTSQTLLRSTIEELSQPRKEGEERTDIVVVGGDGTMHAVLNALVDVDAVNVGLIPAGTGNDFSVSVQIPADSRKAAELILTCKPKDTDYLTVGGVRCMNVGGLGIDVDVLKRYNKSQKIHGKLKYLRCLIQSLLTFKGCDIQIESEGKSEKHRAFFAVACNGGQIGGGIKICPAANPADGFIDVCCVDMVRGLKMAGAFVKLMKGEILQYPKTTHFLCKQVRFCIEGGATVQLDGELYDHLDFNAEIKTGLKFYRP
ncbi:MAG: YegS/Rv2252/BmrU family lipid kinase [Candidatus Borkfalkiaceae bacterium]|nr:YegS/Rv2252/BmrU family lipid kinase [Clostridia bacterium]MDY6224066.1 YegS/Rv2252/BmrU family lipid kinase [Christensenellaceae bacterium]